MPPIPRMDSISYGPSRDGTVRACRLEESIGGGLEGEQAFDFTPHFLIVAALGRKELCARLGGAIQSSLTDALDLGFATKHWSVPSPARSRNSHNLANRQSRFTVSTEVSSAAGGLLNAQASEEAQLDDLCLARVNRLEPPQRVIQFDEVPLRLPRYLHRQLQRDFGRSSASLVVVPGASVIDEDPPHRARRHREEVGAILPLDAIEVDEPEVRLVDERCRLQCVTSALMSQVLPGQLTQLLIHQWQEPVEGCAFPISPREQQIGRRFSRVGHGPSLRPAARRCPFSGEASAL